MYKQNLDEIEDCTHGMMDDALISRAIILALLAIAERLERLAEVTETEHQRHIRSSADALR